MNAKTGVPKYQDQMDSPRALIRFALDDETIAYKEWFHVPPPGSKVTLRLEPSAAYPQGVSALFECAEVIYGVEPSANAERQHVLIRVRQP